MRILVLGGTVFLGRALTDAALARGHSVVHFHRGKSSPPDARVETIIGERARPPADLGKRSYDAVIDTSGFLPQIVRRSVDALRGAVARYVFVSSISVYASFEREGLDEKAPVAPPADPVPNEMTPPLYGALKAMCEQVVRDSFDARATVVRPGLIVGPHDPTDRFTYWPVRVARGGVVAAPGRPGLRIQFIDARDLAEWMVDLIERGIGGTFNATGPREPLSMVELLQSCRAAIGGDAVFEWLDDALLLEQGIQPWMQMPLWIPESDVAMRGMLAADISRAVAAGLSFRSVEDTVRDTLRWAQARPAAHAWMAGLDSARESELLSSAKRARESAQAPSAR